MGVLSSSSSFSNGVNNSSYVGKAPSRSGAVFANSKWSGTTDKPTPISPADVRSANLPLNVGGTSTFTTALSLTGVGALSAMGASVFNNLAVGAYKQRAESLGLPNPFLPTPEPSLPLVTPEPTLDNPKPTPEPNLKPATADDKVSLLDVLKQSSNNVGSIAEVLVISNMGIIESINNLTQTIIYGQEVSHSYLDANYNNSLDASETRKTEALANLNARAYEADVSNAYNEQNLENMSLLLEGIGKISTSLENIDVTINRSQNEILLTDKQLAHVTFETEPFQADNLGDVIPLQTPQQMRAIKDAVVAKNTSDQNTLEMSEQDLDDMFGSDMPDISSIFNYQKKSDRLLAVVNSMGVNP